MGATKEIVFTRSGEELASVPVDKNPFRIGRSPANELSLPGKTISRHQCDLIEEDGRWRLLDRSGKGTTVDGKKVGEAKLTGKSRIEIGGLQLGIRDIHQNALSTITAVRSGTTDKKPPEGSASTVLSLLGKVSGNTVKAVLDGQLLRVGSDPENDLVIKETFVSRFHCRFFQKHGTWHIEDLDSTNGTFVNGAKIKEIEIQPGMLVRVGNVDLTVLAGKNDANYPGVFGIVGEDPSMQKVFEQLERAAPSDGPVLITGETGSGKEVVAKAIHQLSKRSNNKLVVLDCSTTSPTLIDSKLFGHKKGSFTDARENRIGVFEEANGATLFIDEIGDLPFDMQPKLLRALENMEIYRIGENDPRKVDTRIISATNKSLPNMVKAGSFRQDLYYRLKVFTVEIPPLRDRPADIPLLASYFVETRNRGPKKELSKRALKKLCTYNFPGNVRELISVITVALYSCKGDSIEPEDIDFDRVTGADRQAEAKTYRKEAKSDGLDRDFLLATLKANHYNKTSTAKYLGISRGKLIRLMEKFGIEKQTTYV